MGTADEITQLVRDLAGIGCDHPLDPAARLQDDLGLSEFDLLEIAIAADLDDADLEQIRSVRDLVTACTGRP